MFDRIHYKKLAQRQLKGRWFIPVMMTLVSALIIMILEVPDFVNAVRDGGVQSSMARTGSAFSYSVRYNPAIPSILIMLVTGILTVANIFVYITMFYNQDKVSFNSFLDGLAMWFRALRGTLWYYLWVLIWSLAFIIPGIVKSFAYSQMFFIIAENPKISVRKAMQISKVMTRGHKGDLFVMCLSFIGWELLCVLTCCIGMLWLIPYAGMSFTNAYNGMKLDALNTGILKQQDFE